MSDLVKRIDNLVRGAKSGLEKLNEPDLTVQIKNLQTKMAEGDFWQDNVAAQEVVKQESKLRAKLEPWQIILKEATDLSELAEDGLEDLKDELEQQLDDLESRYKSLKRELMFDGKFDDHDAILRLSAGVGGTDAQDWTEMLMRMYLRWAEKNNMKTEVLEKSDGEEAGIKSAVISLSGVYAYGKLRSEHGVHRLVRLSPFNSDNLRQTSFALIEVLPQIDSPDEVEIDDKDVRVDVYRAGGHGGQSVNTTDSAVRLTHIPTGITVAIQNERSQLQNKETAYKVLRSKLAQLQVEQHKDKLEEIKGPTKSAEWGAQIRNYVLHPYTMVKDNRTKYEEHDANKVLDGEIDGFINSYLESSKS